ncbi:MAG: hypothetical protein HY744_15875 [Deltaproteobacteria bacterium]|nr:hypothetical protein [Deltaproteobacteria bacterium]
MTEPEGRCGSCAAFGRAYEHPDKGWVGECALEVYPPPVRAVATCSRYRPKGAAAPPPRPRAAGEPRRGSGRPVLAAAPPPERQQPVLPKEIELGMEIEEFRRVLREVLAEELGIGRPDLGARWQGGELVLKPGDPNCAEKRVPLESFFHKVVMVRDKLRLLEAKLNMHPGLSDEEKVQLQSYVTGCYASLTTFNLLFARREEQFVGSGKDAR